VSAWLLRTLVSKKIPSLRRGKIPPCGLTGDADEVVKLQAPQSYRPIISTGDSPLTILRKADIRYARFMAAQYDRCCTRVERIPETDRAILTGRR